MVSRFTSLSISSKLLRTLASLLILFIGITGGTPRSVMETLYGRERLEYLTQLPSYTSDELQQYVANSIKFVLNAAPAISNPRSDFHLWRTRMFEPGGSAQGRLSLIVPLLDDEFKPLFLTGKNKYRVPNFDVVELNMQTTSARQTHGKHYLVPQAILRPTENNVPGTSWAYTKHRDLTQQEKEAVQALVPFHGAVRTRSYGMPVFDQLAHPSFANPRLKCLEFQDLYSPGYVGEGPRPLVVRTTGEKYGGVSFKRDWDHFFAYEQQRERRRRPAVFIPSPQPSADTPIELLSRKEPSSKKARTELRDTSTSHLDLELRL